MIKFFELLKFDLITRLIIEQPCRNCLQWIFTL